MYHEAKRHNYLIHVSVGHSQRHNNNENKNPLEQDRKINIRFDIDNYIYYKEYKKF